MLLHIGGNVSLPARELLAILDIASTRRGDTAAYIARLEAKGRLIRVSPEDPVKSVLITRDAVYFSPISSTTLHKRLRREDAAQRKGQWEWMN